MQRSGRHAFQTVQNASSQAIDTGTIRAAQVEIGQANQLIQEMEDSYRRAAEQEERLNNGIRNGTNAADGMLGKVKSIAASMATAWGAQKIIDLSDQMTSTTARLSFLVDDGGSVSELEQKIMASAMTTRSAYLDTASAIASMGANAGSAFESNDELIAFMEQINKQFVIGGATAEGQTAANTGAAADALSTSTEELAYLRDIAEREAINRFTTAEVRVEQSISNNINNSADLDGVISVLTDGFTEALMTAAEGVHA